MDSRTIDPMKIEADALLPTEYGEFRIKVMVDKNGNEHSILSVGLEDKSRIPTIRIHSECLTGDAFSSMKCDCGPQLKAAQKKVQEEGCGAICTCVKKAEAQDYTKRSELTHFKT